MDVEKIFHMNGGVGKTSYAKNSSLQKVTSNTVKYITIEALQELYQTITPTSLGIADLGCSSGHNSLSIIKEMVDAIEKNSHEISKPVPEFIIHLNDLPTNDFNVLVSAMTEFYKDIRKEKGNGVPSIYVSANPGSFYGRLFPNKSLHFVYASLSLHWLSKVPQGLYDEQGRSINKTSMYISESSPPQVSEAYYRQFQEDMSLFLKSRAEEVIDGGKLVLIMHGRIGTKLIDRGHYLFWELLAQSFHILIAEGGVEKEKLESYNIHYYAPSKEEFEDQVRKEGSFEIERLEMLEIDRKAPEGMSFGKVVAAAVRAIQESTIKHHFGDKIINSLFENYARLFDEEMSIEKIRGCHFVVVLGKKT